MIPQAACGHVAWANVLSSNTVVLKARVGVGVGYTAACTEVFVCIYMVSNE